MNPASFHLPILSFTCNLHHFAYKLGGPFQTPTACSWQFLEVVLMDSIPLTSGVSQIFITVIKVSDKNSLEEENFILTHNFRGLVHGGPTLLLCAKGEVECHGRRAWWKSSVLFFVARNQREEGEGAARTTLLGNDPSDPPPIAMPHLLIVTT